MPVSRSEAMFFTGGLIAGVAAVAAYPWLKRQYDTYRDHLPGMPDTNPPSSGDVGRSISDTFDAILRNAPDYVEAGKSGLQAGFEAACRMAQTMARPESQPMGPAPRNDAGQAA